MFLPSSLNCSQPVSQRSPCTTRPACRAPLALLLPSAPPPQPLPSSPLQFPVHPLPLRTFLNSFELGTPFDPSSLHCVHSVDRSIHPSIHHEKWAGKAWSPSSPGSPSTPPPPPAQRPRRGRGRPAGPTRGPRPSAPAPAAGSPAARRRQEQPVSAGAALPRPGTIS
jgi:hypothetical protein